MAYQKTLITLNEQQTYLLLHFKNYDLNQETKKN